MLRKTWCWCLNHLSTGQLVFLELLVEGMCPISDALKLLRQCCRIFTTQEVVDRQVAFLNMLPQLRSFQTCFEFIGFGFFSNYRQCLSEVSSQYNSDTPMRMLSGISLRERSTASSAPRYNMVHSFQTVSRTFSSTLAIVEPFEIFQPGDSLLLKLKGILKVQWTVLSPVNMPEQATVKAMYLLEQTVARRFIRNVFPVPRASRKNRVVRLFFAAFTIVVGYAILCRWWSLGSFFDTNVTNSFTL